MVLSALRSGLEADADGDRSALETSRMGGAHSMMDRLVVYVIEVASRITGRNFWLRLAAHAADRDGDHHTARELRSHILWRQMKGLR